MFLLEVIGVMVLARKTLRERDRRLQVEAEKRIQVETENKELRKIIEREGIPLPDSLKEATQK
jgi:hypothetical protein